MARFKLRNASNAGEEGQQSPEMRLVEEIAATLHQAAGVPNRLFKEEKMLESFLMVRQYLKLIRVFRKKTSIEIDRMLEAGYRSGKLTDVASVSMPVWIDYLQWIRGEEGKSALVQIISEDRLRRRQLSCQDVLNLSLFKLQRQKLLQAVKDIQVQYENETANHLMREIMEKEVAKARSQFKPACDYTPPTNKQINERAWREYKASQGLLARCATAQQLALARELYADKVVERHQLEFLSQGTRGAELIEFS